ncbi:MAG TPA: FAD-binding oxidoreductase [Actinoplanes sp.]|nr:FAD-binding oxidoreductase [Actinoplanes sp.]
MQGSSPAGRRDQVLRSLMEICGPHFARLAGHADTVSGRRARYVAAPATTAGVADALLLAAKHGLDVTARGAGTKIDWGFPSSRVDVVLDAGRLAGVWHHRPEALTAEVGSGTPVRALQAALARQGQRLAVDPPSAGATVGGVLSVNEAGPISYRFGTPHRQVKTYTYVDPAGNLGTVPTVGSSDRDGVPGPPPGVLVSATLKLHRLPEASRWVSYPVWTPLQMHDMLARTLDAEVSPVAIEVDLPALVAPGSSPQRPGAVAVLLEGAPVAVRERATRLAAELGTDSAITALAPGWWGRYPFSPDDIVLRVSVPIAELHAAVYALRDAAGGAVPVRGSAGRGVVHAVLPRTFTPQRVEGVLDAIRGVLLARGGRCVVVTAPPAIREAVDMARREDLR